MGCNGQWWVSQGGFDETLNTDWKLNKLSTQTENQEKRRGDSFEYNAGIDHMGNDHCVCQLFVMELSWWEVTLPSRERTERGESSPYQKWCWFIYRVQGLGLQWLYISRTGHSSHIVRGTFRKFCRSFLYLVIKEIGTEWKFSHHLLSFYLKPLGLSFLGKTQKEN